MGTEPGTPRSGIGVGLGLSRETTGTWIWIPAWIYCGIPGALMRTSGTWGHGIGIETGTGSGILGIGAPETGTKTGNLTVTRRERLVLAPRLKLALGLGPVAMGLRLRSVPPVSFLVLHPWGPIHNSGQRNSGPSPNLVTTLPLDF